MFTSKSSTLLVFAVVMALSASSSQANKRPHRCPVCTEADLMKCAPLPKDCEPIQEPNCGCCLMCAKKEGEHCGVATGTCETGLECIPPPLSSDDYKDYGPANYFMEAFLGNFVCVTRRKFLDILTGAFYDDEPKATIDDTDSLYIPDLEMLKILEELDELDKTSFLEPETPTLSDVGPIESTSRPEQPLSSEFSHLQKPCKQHDQFVWSKEHFDHHEWIPSCAHDGTYFPEQCELSYGLERGRCWCVDSVGRPLTGFTDGDKASPEQCYDVIGQ